MLVPSSEFSARIRSSTVTLPPVPTLYTRPDTPGVSAARISAFATSDTYTKSRDCKPSPWTVGVRPAASAAAKMAITPEYGLSARCRGPNTLKNRSRTVSRP